MSTTEATTPVWTVVISYESENANCKNWELLFVRQALLPHFPVSLMMTAKYKHLFRFLFRNFQNILANRLLQPKLEHFRQTEKQHSMQYIGVHDTLPLHNTYYKYNIFYYLLSYTLKK